MSPRHRRPPARTDRSAGPGLGPPAELTAYVLRVRRLRRWYAVAILLTAVLVALGVQLAYDAGELSHTIVRTAPGQTPAPALTPVQARLSAVWSVDQASATGQPVAGGIVVTHTSDTVYGRAVVSGAVVWTYTRTDATICAVAGLNGKTLVLIRRHTDCDELSALDTATGARAWQRSLDTDATFVTGMAAMTTDVDAVNVLNASSIAKISVSANPCDSATGQDCGLNYWFYKPNSGCQLSGYAPGKLGDLIGERCRDGGRLVMHERYSTKPEAAIRWTIAVSRPLVPATADTVVGAIDFGAVSEQLTVFDPATGAVKAHVSLAPRPTAGSVSQTMIGGGDAVCVASQCYSVTSSQTAVPWQSPTPTAPITPPDHELYTVSDSTVRAVSDEGAARGSWSVQGGAGEQAVRVGGGFVLFGPRTAFLASQPA